MVAVIVWVVMRGDGNVCCPAAELDSIWTTEQPARDRAAHLSSLASTAESAYVSSVMTDAVPEVDP